MTNFVEYIGGPRDGQVDNLGEQQLPQQIVIPGRRSDYYANIFSMKDPEPSAEREYLTGTYHFTKLHQALWKDAQWGDYVWQGWE